MDQIIESNNKNKIESNHLSDCIDGLIYKNNMKQYTQNEIIISLNLNTDGASLTNSQSFSIWPVIATIVELDPITRESFRNIIILGIWLGKKKLKYDIFISKSI
jgi:hypothetical protein